MLQRSLTKQLANHARPADVTEGYAADWTVEQLREPAQRIAARIDKLAARPRTAKTAQPRDSHPPGSRFGRNHAGRRARRAWRSLALFDRFLDEAERVGVLDQGPNFGTIQTGWNFGVDLEFQGHLAAGKGRELLDDGLDDSMDIPRRPLR